MNIKTGDHLPAFRGVYGDSTGNILYLSQRNAIWRYNITSNSNTLYAGHRAHHFDYCSSGHGYVYGDKVPLADSCSNYMLYEDAKIAPVSLFLSSTGLLYFVDEDKHTVRVINPQNDIIETFAGNGEREYKGDNVPATSTSLNYPRGIWGNSLGFIFIADARSNRVRVVNPAGIISAFAGNGYYSEEWSLRTLPPRLEKSELGDNGPATLARFQIPVDVKGDIEGNIFITEVNGCRIRMVSSPSNIITTIIGDYCRYDKPELPLPALYRYISYVWVENKNTIYFHTNRRLILATLIEDSDEEEEGKVKVIPEKEQEKNN